MLAFEVQRHIAVVDPAVTVRTDLVAGRQRRLCHGRVTLERHGHPEDSERHLVTGKKVKQPPHTHPGAILVDRLHAQVPLARPGLSADDLGQERFGGRIAVQHTTLATLLVVDDKLQSDAGPARPVGWRRGLAIADQVPGIGGIGIHALVFVAGCSRA